MPSVEQAIEKTAGYLVLRETTCRNVNGDSSVHLPGVVLSKWEVDDFCKRKVAEGSIHYRTHLEPLTADEVANHREKATALEGDRLVNGQHVSPPWPDYVGLHPEEVLDRMRVSKDRGEVERVRLYERGGLNRERITGYTAPSEREPWVGYEELNYREILEKFQLLSPEAVREAQSYESSHRKRPPIIEYEPEPSQDGSETKTSEEVAA